MNHLSNQFQEKNKQVLLQSLLEEKLNLLIADLILIPKMDIGLDPLIGWN